MPAPRPTPSARRRPRRRLAVQLTALTAVGLTATALAGPGGAFAAGSTAALAAGRPAPLDLDLLGRPALTDVDTRVGSVAPSATQLKQAATLGATTRWNRYGTPQSMINYGGALGTGLRGSTVDQARSFVRAQKALFKLTDADVSGLEVLKDTALAGTDSHVVMFRQKFGTLGAAEDGLITIGMMSGGKVAYVSSSAAGHQSAPAGATLTPQQAWSKAAASIGRTVQAPDLSGVRDNHGWTTFAAKGFAQPQLARLVALPVPAGLPRAAYEVDVIDVRGAAATAFIAFVDARTGDVLLRRNAVDNLAAAVPPQTFQGSFTPPSGCGPMHPFTVDTTTKSILVTAAADVTTNDIVLKVFRPDGMSAGTSDNATSPEAVTVTSGVVPGKWSAQVCPFGSASMTPYVAPYSYVGNVVESDTAAPGGGTAVPYPPKWSYFHNFPPTYASTDTRSTDCWVNQTGYPKATVPGCEASEQLQNLAARAPWDVDPRTSQPTFTTVGNAASTAQAWGSPLTPAEMARPVSPTREYTKANFPRVDQWQQSKCSPTNFGTPQRNDIDASVINLFSGHNRFHDWSYFLGFTEENYNAQQSNFGNNGSGSQAPNGGEGDPEIGNVQAGAVSGGAPSYLGRDNANQITLQDGVPGITNQYLFQPIGGAFYAPCVDGDYDTTVFGHEYTHLISGRMVGGPDTGISGAQGGAMNESWSDQTALEYLNENGYFTEPGHTNDNPFVEGHYVTGNATTGIRDYALNQNPLNYSDIGFDLTGPEVHADGEIWNAVGTDLRIALTKKYASQYGTGAALKQVNADCADGKRAPQTCPGNRRFIQIQFDAYLLQQGNTSMLDGRDAYLAADKMRFGGANQATIWHVFAGRGMGQNASTKGTDDTDPIPGFVSPLEGEGTIKAIAQDYGSSAHNPVKATFYVGDYSARATPIADTDPATALGDTFQMVPGTYHFVAVSKGYGITRLTRTITAGRTTALTLHAWPNLAAGSRGATATGTGGNFQNLIDENEGTNYADLNRPTPVDTGTPSQVTVKLAGSKPVHVGSIRVSALLHAAMAGDSYDKAGQNRFTALRKFKLQTCNASPTNANCTTAAGFNDAFTSPDAAFPSTLPRPLAPDLTLRAFDIPNQPLATHVRLVVLENQCTGTPAYAGTQDSDPANETDCKTPQTVSTNPGGPTPARTVRAAELEVFPFGSSTRPPGDPVVTLAGTAPATAKAGSTYTTTFTYTNAGPETSAGAVLTDSLPAGVSFVSGSNGATYDPQRRTVSWSLGDIPVAFTGSRTLVLRVDPTTAATTPMVQRAELTAPLTLAPPAVVTTLSTR